MVCEVPSFRQFGGQQSMGDWISRWFERMAAFEGCPTSDCSGVSKTETLARHFWKANLSDTGATCYAFQNLRVSQSVWTNLADPTVGRGWTRFMVFNLWFHNTRPVYDSSFTLFYMFFSKPNALFHLMFPALWFLKADGFETHEKTGEHTKSDP